MIRVKSFDATGVAPNGRLFAGDLNAIQDAAAGLSDFAQTVDVSALRVGDSGIQLIKHGPAEARLTAGFRTDGIARGLGGLFAGTFTTAQRDAIPLGSRPFGLLILNTNTAQLEINLGSDATPTWRPVGGGAWTTGDYKMSTQNSDHADPAGGNWRLCNGTALPGGDTALISAIGANRPDAQGRTLVMKGTHADISGLLASDGLAVGTRRPRHRHTFGNPVVNNHAHGGGNHYHGGGTGWMNHNNPHSHVVWRQTHHLSPGETPYSLGGYESFDWPTNAVDVNHTHNIGAEAVIAGEAPGTNSGTVGPQTGAEPVDAPAYLVPGNLFIHT